MAQQSGSGQVPLIKPAQIDTIPQFSAEQKSHYKNGLSQLWHTLENTQPGSAQYTDAESKIKQASLKIMQQINKGPRPASGGGQQQQQQQRPQGQQGGSTQGGGPMQQPGSSQGGVQGGQPQVVPQSQGPQQLQLNSQARQEISQIQINVPMPVVGQGEAAVNAYKTQWFKKAVELLTRRDQARGRGTQLQNMAKSGQVQGAQAQQLQQEMEKMRNEINVTNAAWDKMKNANTAQGNGQVMQRQHSSGGGAGQGQMGNGQQQDVNMSPTQPQGGFPQQQQPNTSQPTVAPSPVQQQQAQQAMGPQANAAQNYQQQQQNMAQQGQQQQNQPQRPQMNQQQLAQAQAQQNMAQQQQQQQQHQNSAVPQSASQQQQPPQQQQQQQQQQQRPQPLTHQAAVNQAAQSYSREQAQQAAQQQHQNPQQNIPQLQTGGNQMAMNGGAPQSATQTTPSSAYPATAVLSQSTHGGSTTKFPIPKQLNLDPRSQMPVPGPPSRPTYQASGMMQQPGVQRQVQFTLEGEGDRVLSKRKLDELVRQVTGTPATDPSSDSHALAPDVEEAVLTLADDFVDSIITSACRLAKLRSSQTLDIRDIQVVLERNYGIRIPGHSLDEVRTVRKFQPAAGWTQKMQAVHSAKVMRDSAKDS